MKLFYGKHIFHCLAAASLLLSCSSSEQQQQSQESLRPLKETLEGDFLVGAALNYDQVYGRDEKAVAIIKKHFNTISPENMLKMGPIHPKQNEFNWEAADKYVAFGEENGMFTVGHALVWHSQAPDWIYTTEAGDTVSRDTLIQRMQNHISAVAGRYKGKIDGWDVVNEALNDDGTMRQSNWYKIIGEDFLEKAFEFAHQTDPDAELYYNDYNLWKADKAQGAVRIVRNLQEKGIKIDGVGMQGHYGLHYPSLEQIEASILAFSDLGVKVMITEMDIDILPNPSGRQGADIGDRVEDKEGFNPYEAGLPDSVQQQLSARYAELFGLFHKHRDKISRVTFWGVADHHSWLNNWPMTGRTSYPLVFDRNYAPKPALDSIVQAVRK